MTQTKALVLIDAHKNALLDPVEMLHWTWLRVTIAQISKEAWEKAATNAHTILSK